jgi:hypothetical protein
MAPSIHHEHRAHEHHLTVTGPPWLPMALALVLGVAAVVSGLTAWRVAVHSGAAQTGFALATRESDVTRAVGSERSLYIAWEQATTSGDAALATSVFSMMEPSTQAAVTWWTKEPAANRPPTPFSSANPYWSTPARVFDSTQVASLADQSVQSAEDQLNRAHDLELLGALLAIALLTGGLTATLRSTRAQMVLLGVSCSSLLVATISLGVQW